jgi:predicted CoA-binding protein
MVENLSREDLRKMLQETRVIAVVGLSDKPYRASHRVAAYMQQQGYRIIPVNPTIKEALGEKAYPSLREVPERVDLVDIFRRSESVPPVVEDAIAIGAKVVWMQSGIVNEEAAEKAQTAGLQVVMDRCLMVDHSQLRP